MHAKAAQPEVSSGRHVDTSQSQRENHKVSALLVLYFCLNFNFVFFCILFLFLLI